MTIVENILVGMGWAPNYGISHLSSTWSGILLFICFTIGLLLTILRKNMYLLPLLFSVFFQIILIVFINYKLSYLFSARQFLNFLPLSLLTTSISMSTLLTHNQPILFLKKSSKREKQLNYKKYNQFFGSIILLILVIFHVPVLLDYYKSVKSYAKEITQVFKDVIQPNDIILIYPEYEPLLFNYYFKEENIIYSENQLTGISLENLAQFNTLGKNQYLIVNNVINYDQENEILKNGYSLFWDRTWQDRRAHRVYNKK